MATVEPQATLSAVDIVRDMLENFAPTTQAWQDQLADNIVLEFPYGAAIELDERHEGKENAVGLFIGVSQALNLKFKDVDVKAMADPEWVVVEMRGDGHFQGRPYKQHYINLLRVVNGKLAHYREFFNTRTVNDCFGTVPQAMAALG